MSNKRYTDEFKIEAIKQVTERGYSVKEVANRLGVNSNSLYNWMRKFDEPKPRDINNQDLQAENAKLKAELRRIKEERDILKKAAAYFANDPE